VTFSFAPSQINGDCRMRAALSFVCGSFLTVLCPPPCHLLTIGVVKLKILAPRSKSVFAFSSCQKRPLLGASLLPLPRPLLVRFPVSRRSLLFALKKLRVWVSSYRGVRLHQTSSFPLVSADGVRPACSSIHDLTGPSWELCSCASPFPRVTSGRLTF